MHGIVQQSAALNASRTDAEAHEEHHSQPVQAAAHAARQHFDHEALLYTKRMICCNQMRHVEGLVPPTSPGLDAFQAGLLLALPDVRQALRDRRREGETERERDLVPKHPRCYRCVMLDFGYLIIRKRARKTFAYYVEQ